MSQYPGTVHFKDVEKVAAYLGFELKRQSSSHKQNKKAGSRTFPIPTYKDITVDSHLFKSILRSLEIAKKEFFDILEK